MAVPPRAMRPAGLYPLPNRRAKENSGIHRNVFWWPPDLADPSVGYSIAGGGESSIPG
jgi:hypothetical protein